MHVEKFQERHFLEINKFNAKNHTGLGGGVLLITLTQGSYSWQMLLLNPLTQGGYSRLPTDVFKYTIVIMVAFPARGSTQTEFYHP